MKPIYLDYNATTPVLPEVLAAMEPYWNQQFGNASSKHIWGWAADEAVSVAREQVAQLIGANPEEIVFTSGATESLNLAIQGLVQTHLRKGRHIVALATEHRAVLDTLAYLSQLGFEVEYIGVDRNGMPRLDALDKAIRTDTLMVCAMLANNETGVIFPVREIAAIAHEKNCYVVVDATQAAGKINVDVNACGADLMALSAHKFYGPKGVGALYIRRKNPRVEIAPIVHGGGHEHALRSGTLNVSGIVGMGAAAQFFSQNQGLYAQHCAPLLTEFERSLQQLGAVIHAQEVKRLPNTAHVHFPGISASKLIAQLPSLAFSTGSACSSANQKPSHVTQAMGFDESESLASVRFSLGMLTTSEEIKTASNCLEAVLRKLR